MTTTLERRFVGRAPAVKAASTRSEGAKGRPVIRGHGAVFDDQYKLYEDDSLVIVERVLPGAFDNALKERQDVRALFNHDPNLILGRTKSKTLRLSLDSRGLVYEVDPPDTQAGRDVVTSLKRGDVDGSSFGFSVRPGGEVLTRLEDSKTGKRMIDRALRDLDLFDVSPVTYPAYTKAESGLRSKQDARALVDRIKAADPPKRDDSRFREMAKRQLRFVASDVADWARSNGMPDAEVEEFVSEVVEAAAGAPTEEIMQVVEELPGQFRLFVAGERLKASAAKAR